jgi:hypothetical protein
MYTPGWVLWGTYARQIPLLPEMACADKEKVLEVAHSKHGVEKKAEEVWECVVRNTVCGPGTVVVHFRDTSGVAVSVKPNNSSTNYTYFPQTRQWCALSGFRTSHFLHHLPFFLPSSFSSSPPFPFRLIPGSVRQARE